MSKKTVSLSDLNASDKSSNPFEFEYVNPEGDKTGIFFSVLGAECEIVTKEVARLINERRQKAAQREASLRQNTKVAASFSKLEDDVEFGQRLAAVRLVGWRGISEVYTPEGGLLLCKSNRHIAGQITEQSDDIGNFMRF